MGTHLVHWWPTFTPTMAFVSVATVTDLRSRRIPNWLVFPALGAGMAVSTWMGGWRGLGQSVLGAGLALLLFGIFFLLGGMGAGDVKLCAAVGAWIGPGQMVMALLMTALAGGVMALVWALAGGFLMDLLRGSGALLFRRGRHPLSPDPELTLANPLRRRMPYAPAIALGTLVSFLGR
jgi:prepilin peptidase CpaA